MGRGARRGRKPLRSKARSHPRGIIEVNRAGYGFVKTAEGDFFIPRSGVREAFDGDLVEVARAGRRRRAERGSDMRQEAKVVRVIERSCSTLVGIYEVAEPFGVVIPDDPRIHHDVFCRLEDAPDVRDGSLVRVAIDQYPTARSAATGHVIEVLGTADDARLSSERIIARNDLRTTFPEAALKAADAATVDAAEALRGGYRDIRDRFTFTIDPVDAKDFDDALSVEAAQSDDGKPCAWRLGVHIADVSHYVPWGEPLDGEARKRGTSVYLADRVVPMLPEALSNDVCSLKPGEDRRCMTVDLYVRDDASLVGFDIYPAIMRSDARLTYAEALDILEGRKGPADGEVAPRLAAASALARSREAYRASRGGIAFNTKEAKVRLDAEGQPTGIDVRTKDEATTLVEEAMIFANEVVAAFLDQQDVRAAYRVHEPPHADALEGVVKVLQEFAWFTPADAAGVAAGDPFAVQRVLDEARGRTEEQLVTSLLLRAMTRAVYSPYDDGHYGLGLASYCHFTSPIRRYPDLIVHRQVRARLTDDARSVRAMSGKMEQLCEHCSEMERIAESASRESQEAMMAEYLAGSIGQAFTAHISGVTTYGIFVQLDCTAEGLVPIRSLGDEYFAYDAAAHSLRGTDTGTVYRLGQAVEVVLEAVDVAAPSLTFGLVRKRRRKG